MVTIRTYQPAELPAILQRGLETALAQVTERERPAATNDRVASQLVQMYQNALRVPRSTILVADWPPGMAADGPAAYALLMPQPNPFTAEGELIVLDIYTHPSLRGRRVGRAMLERAAAYAKSIGCASVVAQVAFHNRSSMAMFVGSGYGQERAVLGRRV